MLVLLLSVVYLVSSVNSAGITSLMDLPLTMPSGNYMVHATLTDKDNGDKYFMQEFISSGAVINGMIVITTPKDTFNVYYNFNDKDAKDNYDRLVIQGTDCSLYEFKNKGKLLPGISKPLTSLLLAMGPSILYRIDYGLITWELSADENVRGTMMKSLTSSKSINNKLDITYYYKSNLEQQEGLQQPSRIVFNGTDPSTLGSTRKENLILDIYLQERDMKNDFTKFTQPIPGIGCPVYYADDLPIPTLNTNLVHMILAETISGPSTTKTVSEIHANDKLKLMRLQTSILGISTEALYDYTLGVVYLFQDGGSCNNLPIEITGPGIDQRTAVFSLKTLLQLDGNFNYLGEVYFEHRAGFVVKAWESIQYNVTTSTGKYDKAVITQYFTETTGTNAFNGYLIVATIITAYKLDSSKTKYQLAEITTRDYMDFQVAETESEFHDKFTLAECKYITSDMKLTFQLGCTGSDCLKFAEDRVYELKDRFKESILTNYYISPLRLSQVDVTFRTSTIDIEVDFLEAPNLQTIFAGETMFVSDDTVRSMARTESKSESDCLNRILSYYNFHIGIYCGDGNVCGVLSGTQDVKEDIAKGAACQVFRVPLKNLQRISREILNKDLQSRLLRDTASKTVSLTDGYTTIIYKIVDILEETRSKTDKSRNLFDLLISGQNLNLQDSSVIEVPNVKTFGDCFRACSSSDELDCRTLSFCTNTDSIECYVTNMTSFKAPIDKKSSPNCAVYYKNHLLEYSTIYNRRFIQPTSVSETKYADECAAECSSTEGCYSFQFCGRICSLGGQYTDSGTEYDVNCQIYIPKVSEKYQATGRKMVTETFLTELNLNEDQCAALCYDWADGVNSCQSFNFCPKGRSTSSCSLTAYSVKDQSTKTIEGNNCFNYELIDSKSNVQQQSTSKKGTSGSAAFGIIMIFLATGFLFGIGLPFVYSKVNRLTHWNNRDSSDQRFVWRRQVDDQLES